MYAYVHVCASVGVFRIVECTLAPPRRLWTQATVHTCIDIVSQLVVFRQD